MDHQINAERPEPDKEILLTGILLAFILPLALTLWMSNEPMAYYDKLFYSRFIYWVTVVCLFSYACLAEHQPLLVWTESKPTLGFFLLSVLVLYLLFIGAAIASSIPMLFGMREDNVMIKSITKALQGHNLMIAFIALTAGVTEEFIFRGYMLTRLSQLFKNNAVAIVISSLLFSALHYKYGSLRELIFAFLIGLIFSVYYIKYHNIKAIMLTHFLIDLISMNLAQHVKLK